MEVGMFGTSEGEGGERGTRPQKGKRTVVGKYTRHACAQCKKAKTKCEGGKPVCERCQKTGHECNWSLEDARRPLTRAHEQALKHQNALLRAEVERLGREVAALRLIASTGSRSYDPPSIASPTSSGQDNIASPPKNQYIPSPPIVSTDSGKQKSSSPGTTMMHDVGTAESRAAAPWGLLPVEDIGSDVQEDFDIVGSESEGGKHGPETEFESSAESAYESDDGSEDSDIDVDKALIGPTKTLFSEQDDLHHYGLTSVFRLRRRPSRRSLYSRSHLSNESAASGYESMSSSRGIGSNRTAHPSLRSFLSSSSANESSRAGPSNQLTSSRHSDGSHPRSRLKRDRKGRGRINGNEPRAHSPVRTQRHILLVGDINNGAWKGCECQSDCWSRWLPKGVILSRREHDVLLDRIFLFFTSFCMRIIPEYFLRDMYTFLHTPSSHSTSQLTQEKSTSLPKLAHYSPFLHNTILAVATAFSSDTDIKKLETRARFAEEGKAYIEEECSRPNISTVQGLGLLASYYSGQGQQTLGFTYFGMSARIAQALGLFADCTPLLRAGRLRPRQVFDRTWAFHMAAAQDACWSLYVGRDCGIPLPPAKKKSGRDEKNGPLTTGGVSNNPPIISMDDPFCMSLISTGETAERLDMMTWRVKGGLNEIMGDSVPRCLTFTTMQWCCQLLKIGRSIMDLMNRLASSDSGTEIKLLVADIDIQLDAWRQDLPADLKLIPTNEMSALPHKLMMHAAFWWHHILLHRPFYQRNRVKSVDSKFSVTRCNVAAREIIHVLRLWRKIYGTIRYCPITLVQTIFATGTIYILQAMQASSGRRPAAQSQASALSNFEEAVGFLRECGESWECATRIADIFDNLLKEQRHAMESGECATKKGAKKKRRRLANLRDTETAVQAAQSALLNHSPILSDERTDSASHPEASSPANLSPATTSFLQNVSPDNLNPPFLFQFDQAQTQTSLVFESPSENSNGRRPNAFPAEFASGLSGAHAPTYPTGYMSDESYASDAPYLSTDDRDCPMNAGSSQASPNFDFDLSFLLSSEVNMDGIMPGLGMFDPIGLPGLGLGQMTADSGSQSWNASIAQGFAAPGHTQESAGESNASRAAEGLTRGDDNNRAMYEILSSLNNPQFQF